ncbi:hypothetical protein [Enterococcus sp. BWT-B8]|nr:hypothetical protein [Enterococcus sp. BWT-B8]
MMKNEEIQLVKPLTNSGQGYNDVNQHVEKYRNIAARECRK